MRVSLRDVVTTLTAVSVVLVARASFADHYRVPTGSMEPTVQVGDQVCVDKSAYGLRLPGTERYVVRGGQPAHGDVVVLHSPADGEVLLKRVVALPGEVVEVTDGRVSIGGEPVEVREVDGGALERLGAHEHALGTTYGGGPDFGPTTVPPDRFLVMGDNRGNSFDGRSFGWVPRASILGRAVAVCVRDGSLAWDPL